MRGWACDAAFPSSAPILPLCSFKANAMLWLEWEVLCVLTWPHGSLLLRHAWVMVRGVVGKRKGFTYPIFCGCRHASLQWHSYCGCAGEPTNSRNVKRLIMGILLCLWLTQETSVHLHSIPFKLTHYDSIMLESEPAGLTLSLQKAIGLEQVSLKS